MLYQIIEGCFSAATDGTADFVEQQRRERKFSGPACGNLRENTLEVGLP